MMQRAYLPIVTKPDEEAEDEGGVTKEFFLLLIKEILNPDYGMFKVQRAALEILCRICPVFRCEVCL